jgi:hypothetical protein
VRSAGLEVKRVTVAPDSTVTVETGKAEDDGSARDASVVAMDRIAAMRKGTR